jgi:hypothetical protein
MGNCNERWVSLVIIDRASSVPRVNAPFKQNFMLFSEFQAGSRPGREDRFQVELLKRRQDIAGGIWDNVAGLNRSNADL